ncbi:hypothetical protein JXK06_01770 [Patescibacteria group bacterium]|nr:hypothetical protein [Patescibacteria group bacterium]
MISQELKKILNLVKTTGDRVVVYDAQESEETFVVMDLNSYENLVLRDKKLNKNNEDSEPENQIKNKNVKELTEEDLTDKINREISLWKNQENPSFVAGDQKVEKPTKPWSIPPKVKEKAKEVE